MRGGPAVKILLWAWNMVQSTPTTTGRASVSYSVEPAHRRCPRGTPDAGLLWSWHLDTQGGESLAQHGSASCQSRRYGACTVAALSRPEHWYAFPLQ